MNPTFIGALLLTIVSVLAVFVEIPFFSNYAFWSLFAATVMLLGRGA